MGRPVAFLDVFDRTHRAERGKGAYKDKKSEAVIVSIIFSSIHFSLKLISYVYEFNFNVKIFEITKYFAG